MTALRDTARAKLNLTLEVLGRRDDGYHELRSLVAFAELGDALELEPGEDLALKVEGPFAGALARRQSRHRCSRLPPEPRRRAIKLGAFRLTKYLPVAAGLGGGSADAAAALRLIASANAGALDEDELAGDRRGPRLRRPSLSCEAGLRS